MRVAEKTFAIENGTAIDVKISVDHDMVEVFVGEQVAFTYRIFRKPEYEIGLLAQDAKVEFANIAIRKLSLIHILMASRAGRSQLT